MKDLCTIKVERDGIVFDESTVAGEQIIEDADIPQNWGFLNLFFWDTTKKVRSLRNLKPW